MKQKTTSFNRRWFLNSAAAGVTLGTFGWIRKLQAAEPMPKSSAISSGLSFPLRVYSEPFPKHAELLLVRSRNAREQLRQSLSKPGARPVNVAAYQMANRCRGEKGKQSIS